MYTLNIKRICYLLEQTLKQIASLMSNEFDIDGNMDHTTALTFFSFFFNCQFWRLSTRLSPLIVCMH